MAHIGFDLDGTLYPFVDDVDRYLVKHGYTRDEREDIWEVWEHYGLDASDFWKIINRGIIDKEIFVDGEPTIYARDVLTQLLADGHDLYVVTARTMNIQAKRSTFRWLEKHLPIPWSGVIISTNKAILPFKVFVDDHMQNLNNVENAGTIPICFAQSWNTDWQGEHRYENLWEVYDAIKESD